MRTNVCLLLGLIFPFTCKSAAATTSVQSPDGQIRAAISVTSEGRVQYQVWRQDETVIAPSDLGMLMDGTDLGANVALGEPTQSEQQEYFPWRGGHSIATNLYRGFV